VGSEQRRINDVLYDSHARRIKRKMCNIMFIYYYEETFISELDIRIKTYV
jgi:hypothetical protein